MQYLNRNFEFLKIQCWGSHPLPSKLKSETIFLEVTHIVPRHHTEIWKLHIAFSSRFQGFSEWPAAVEIQVCKLDQHPGVIDLYLPAYFYLLSFFNQYLFPELC